PARAIGERRQQLLGIELHAFAGSADETVSGAPRIFRNLRTAGSDVNGNRLSGLVVDGRVLRVVVLPVERHALLGPEQLDQLDGFAQSRETLFVVRPCNPESAFIEVLSRTHAQDHPSWVERPQSSKRLRDDGGVIAKRRVYY